jgi:hypothetical protein
MYESSVADLRFPESRSHRMMDAYLFSYLSPWLRRIIRGSVRLSLWEV